MNAWPNRILVVLEESELGLRTARMGIEFARRLGAPLSFVLSFAPPHIEGGSAELLEATATGYESRMAATAAPWFDKALSLAQAGGVAADSHLMLDQEPLDAICEFASKNGCGLIAVGSHGRGTILRALNGSLVKDLVRTSPVPVVICREDMAETFAVTS